MSALRLANIPCSWGVLEFDTEQIGGHMPGHAQVLDEIARSGYEGTELGDRGFMPTDPAALRTELADRELEMVGAFVPVKLADLSAHLEGLERAVRTALLMAEAVGTHLLIILSDDNGTDATRTSLARRVLAEHGLTRDQWLIFAEGAQRIARAVREQVGLRPCSTTTAPALSRPLPRSRPSSASPGRSSSACASTPPTTSTVAATPWTA